MDRVRGSIVAMEHRRRPRPLTPLCRWCFSNEPSSSPDLFREERGTVVDGSFWGVDSRSHRPQTVPPWRMSDPKTSPALRHFIRAENAPPSVLAPFVAMPRAPFVVSLSLCQESGAQAARMRGVARCWARAFGGGTRWHMAGGIEAVE